MEKNVTWGETSLGKYVLGRNVLLGRNDLGRNVVGRKIFGEKSYVSLREGYSVPFVGIHHLMNSSNLLTTFLESKALALLMTFAYL